MLIINSLCNITPTETKAVKTLLPSLPELTEAYSILGSHDLRKRYDKGLHTPHKPTHTPHTHHTHTDNTHVRGQRVKFDFDEFYRAHYGEALKREREARRSAAEAKERAKLYSISQSIQRLLIAAVVASVLAVSWYGQRLENNKHKTQH